MRGPSADERRAVIVTGASRGIGAAIARLVGANGFPVVVNFATNRAAAEQVVRGIVLAVRPSGRDPRRRKS